MRSRSALVIGAGVGGICAAIHLRKQGFHVTVVEKNARPGGRCDHFTREGHHFDSGPTLMVMAPLFQTEFAALGASMNALLDLQRVDPTYHLVFDDRSQLALTSDLKSMYAQLEAFEPGAFQGMLRYLTEGHRHYQLGIEKLVNRDFRKASDFFTLANLPLLFQLKPLVNHYRNM
ncbi:MAG TPA: FAD-dependent oxidoreductase, partial [Anaerolineaceae bacterium]